MDRHPQPTSPARVIGREEMQALALSVVGSLERAGLRDVLVEVNRRVLERTFDDVCEAEWSDRGAWRQHYKLIVELLLYEVRDVARMPHLSDDYRRERISWAMTMAGV